MTLSEQSIKNPVMAWMIMIGVIVFGAISYKSLGVSLMPDVDFPVLTVSVSWPGAAPEVVENEVTDMIEQAVMGVQGVTELTSSSSRGRANITVTFGLDKDIDVAFQEVESKISHIQRDLPLDLLPIEISKSNPDDAPIIWLSLSGSRPIQDMMEYTKDHLQDQFTPIPGVAAVNLGGYLDPALRVWLNPEKMHAKEITPDDVMSAVQAGHQEVPAGYISTQQKEISMRVLGEAGNIEEFADIIIPARKGSPIWNTLRLKDISDVLEGTEDDRFRSRTPEGRSVGLGIQKQPGSNSVEVAHRVKAKAAEIQKYLPKGMNLAVRFDSTQFIEDSAREMNFVIVLSVILTSLVCWLFLGTFGTAVNVFLSIPLSLFGAFFVMKIFGFTLNTFTFLGLSLVIGIVVDDAIMMIENISRHGEEGETRIKAAIKGSREITFAAIAATVAILAIFLPVIFMQGVIGKYFFQFGVTISAAVLFSLLAALTLTPMYAAQFLSDNRGKTGKKPFMDVFMDNFRGWYKKTLDMCLNKGVTFELPFTFGEPGKIHINNRVTVFTASVVLFIISLFLFGIVKKEFVPSQDQGRITVNVNTPPGSSIDFSDAVMLQVEKLIAQKNYVQTYFSNVRSGAGGVFLTLYDKKVRPADPDKKRPLRQQEIIDGLRKEIRKIPGVATVNIQDMSLMGFTAKRGYPVEFMIMGPDWNKLADLSGAMLDAMGKTGIMVDTDSDYKTGVTELLVVPDRKKAAARQVTMQSIGDALNALFGGVRVGKYSKGGKRYDIIMELKLENRTDAKNVDKVFVRNNRGELIKLSEVVTVSEKPAVNSITRENRERAIRIFSNVATGKSQGEAMKNVEDIAKKLLPEGYRIFFTGSSQTFNDSFAGLYVALALGIFVAYMVLGTQFNSFVHPISVLLALPFSLTGAAVALVLSGNSLNIYSAIGVILLMGIVKKNSILLVDFTNQSREKGMNITDALLHACPIRLRPIIMTSCATIAAAIPAALALGPGAETRRPMSLVIIGGVIFSTAFTLFVVPCAYSLLSGLESKEHVKEVHESMKELAGDERERLKLKPVKKK
jgi:hydrophobe/amphiphile efflux-1 (HAE1) family protein